MAFVPHYSIGICIKSIHPLVFPCVPAPFSECFLYLFPLYKRMFQLSSLFFYLWKKIYNVLFPVNKKRQASKGTVPLVCLSPFIADQLSIDAPVHILTFFPETLILLRHKFLPHFPVKPAGILHFRMEDKHIYGNIFQHNLK